MRFAIVSRHYAEYCLRYADALARHGDVLLILDCGNAERELGLLSTSLNRRLTVEYTDLSPRHGVRRLISSIRRIIAFRPDFVHFQEVPDPVTPFVMLGLKPFARIILTIHDPLPHSGSDSSLPSYVYWLARLSRRLANLVVVHGEYCKWTLLRSYPAMRSKLIQSEHGVLMVPLVRETHRDRRSILFFGRMHAYKGLEVLIQASDLLRDRGIQHKIIVAGRGPEADRLASAMEERSVVELHARFIPSDEALSFFQNCGLVVMPYLDATESGVAAAALGNGRPVVASRVGGLPNVVRDGVNGLLVRPGDPVELADALQRILEDKSLLARLSAGASGSAAGQLNWVRITDCLVDNLVNYLNGSKAQVSDGESSPRCAEHGISACLQIQVGQEVKQKNDYNSSPNQEKCNEARL